MNIQEMMVFAIVALSAFFAGRKFIHQFTRGEAGSPKCSKCALNDAVQNSRRQNSPK